MLLIDRLLSWDGRIGTVEAMPRAGALFVDESGRLHPAALLEYMAQSLAAVKGYIHLLTGRPAERGFLVGVKDFRVSGRPRLGDRLLIEVEDEGQLESFQMAKGRVQCSGRVLAQGSLTVYLSPGEGGDASPRL